MLFCTHLPSPRPCEFPNQLVVYGIGCDLATGVSARAPLSGKNEELKQTSTPRASKPLKAASGAFIDQDICSPHPSGIERAAFHKFRSRAPARY